MRILKLDKLKLPFKSKDKNNIYIFNIKKSLYIQKSLKVSSLIFFIFIPIFIQNKILSDSDRFKSELNNQFNSKIKWKNINLEKQYENKIIWKKSTNNDKLFPNQLVNKNQILYSYEDKGISSLNRSIVFDNSIIGPDISWLVPPGFKWNNQYKFDASTRGHNRRDKGEDFLGWNGGDAVGQFYYQFLHNKKTSYGINFGIRSVYEGSAAPGGKTAFGEGQSLGFRVDRKISLTEGFAFGAEQLIHLDNKTDTGRDIYLTLSKALWSNNKKGQFPLDIYTFGFATGKMAEGNINFLCSDLLGGSGTELGHVRRLCWAPVFTITRVHNKKISTFFEHNSKFFLLGTSIIPFDKAPLRGTFAVQISDHIDNYKLNRFDELKWVFRLSLGF